MRSAGWRSLNRAGILAAAILMAGALTGCAGAFDPEGYAGQINAAAGGNTSSDAAMAALQKGDYINAEKLSITALRGDPKNAYATYILAEVYQNTGRPDLARQRYETLVSMNAQETILVGMGDGAKRVPLSEIAKQRLAVLVPQPPAQAGEPNDQPKVAVDENGGGPEGSVIRRFKTLQMLLEDHLISPDEFAERRNDNLGALLPYVASPPAKNLDLPAPAPSEVVDRLNALRTAHDVQRSISNDQWMTERTIILENLLPGRNARRADAPKPIEGAVQAAEVVGRLTRYREAGVISAEEETKTKKVVMDALAQHEAMVAAMQKGGKPVGPGVRLATYGSQDKAMQAWAALQKQFPNELGPLQPVVTAVKLRRGGTVWRLNAGPVADKKAAQAICKAMGRHHQTCVPTVLK